MVGVESVSLSHLGVGGTGGAAGGAAGGPGWLTGTPGTTASQAGMTGMTGYASAWRGQSVRSRYQHVRMKEMLSNALGGSRGGNLFAVPNRTDAVGDAEGDVEGAAGAGGPSRKASMAPPVGRSGSVNVNV